MKEAYCSFEVAKLLKEKGFDCDCTSHFDSNHKERSNTPMNFNSTKYWLSRPTHQMACDWLRKIHHIYIEICFYKTNPNDIEPKKSRLSPYYTFGVWDTVTGNNIDKRLTNDFIGDSYGEAVEAALKYVLKNLI